MSSTVSDVVQTLAAASPPLPPGSQAEFVEVTPAAEPVDEVVDSGLAIDVQPTYSGPVPPAVKAAAAWSWRLLLIGIFAVIVVWAVVQASLILIPIALAVMFAVLLRPARDWLANRALLGRSAATGACVVGSVLLLIGLIYFAGRQLYSGFNDLTGQLIATVNTIQQWLAGPPLNITNEQFNTAWQQIQIQFGTGDMVQTLISGAMSAAGTFGNIVYGILICLFCTIFFLADGRNIWNWIVNLLPIKARERVHQAGRRSMVTLSSYVRTVFVVAAIEGTLIGLGLAFFVPSLAVPVAVLSFISAFIPMLGAIITGLIATLLVLVSRGLVSALIMLGIVLLVNQLESHVLQPILMGHAVSLHPVAVVIVVAVGLMIAGVAGALFAVPLAAVINTFVQYLLGYDKFPNLGENDHVPLLRKPKIEEAQQRIQESFRRVGLYRREALADGDDIFLTDSDLPGQEATKKKQRHQHGHHKDGSQKDGSQKDGSLRDGSQKDGFQKGGQKTGHYKESIHPDATQFNGSAGGSSSRRMQRLRKRGLRPDLPAELIAELPTEDAQPVGSPVVTAVTEVVEVIES